MTQSINTDRWSEQYRKKLVDYTAQRILITDFRGSGQEADLSEPVNCGGFGRIRHFQQETSPHWPANPLPVVPAARALGIATPPMMRAQVFQLAGCNWRCWYCFVPFSLLSANPQHAAWWSPTALVDAYLADPDPAPMIDLTGGQPDLVPEWVVWMMQEVQQRGLERHVYLWSDDNLSTDYLWRFLSPAQQALLAGYPNYGRVCCFKGFDAESFAFNTHAAPALFDRQFVLMQQLLNLGLDLYAYTTFTTPKPDGIADAMARFVDRLQSLDPNLPLRTVPLEIQVFTPVAGRMNPATEASLRYQWLAIDCWQRELEQRYSGTARTQSIVDVPLQTRRPAGV